MFWIVWFFNFWVKLSDLSCELCVGHISMCSILYLNPLAPHPPIHTPHIFLYLSPNFNISLSLSLMSISLYIHIPLISCPHGGHLERDMTHFFIGLTNLVNINLVRLIQWTSHIPTIFLNNQYPYEDWLGNEINMKPMGVSWSTYFQLVIISFCNLVPGNVWC